MSYQQQQQYAGGTYQPSSQPQNFLSNPSWQQQQQQSQQFQQQQQPSQPPFNSVQQPRPGSFPPNIGNVPQGYTPAHQQQLAAAMMAQRQQFQATQQPGVGGPGSMGPPSMIPGMGGPLSGIQGLTRDQQQQALDMMRAQQVAIAQQRMEQGQNQGQGSAQGGSGPAPSHKKKRAKPTPAQQMIPRQPPPPRPTEAFRQAAMSNIGEVEPWADGLDEIDPRELAMGRFRARQETLAEIFGPDSIKDILAVEYDPWSGLGTDAETLEEKVAKLESENEGLSARLDTDVETFRQRLAEAEGGEVSSIEVPA